MVICFWITPNDLMVVNLSRNFLEGGVLLSKHERFAIAVDKVVREAKFFNPANVFLIFLF